MKQRVLSIVLVMSMLISMMPVSVLAESSEIEGGAQPEETVQEQTMVEASSEQEAAPELFESEAVFESAEETAAVEESFPEETAENVAETVPSEEIVVTEPVENPEEPAQPEEQETTPGSEAPVEEKLTAVHFTVSIENATLTVYTKDEKGNPAAIDANEDGAYYLEPGQYFYTVVTEETVAVEETEFTVDPAEQTLEILIDPNISENIENGDSISERDGTSEEENAQNPEEKPANLPEEQKKCVITITKQPCDAYISVGYAEFSISATISPEGTQPNYQWQRLDTSDFGTSVWEDIPGANSNVLATDDFYEWNYDNLQYRCVITAGETKLISNTGFLIYEDDGEDEETGEDELGDEAELFSTSSSEIDLFVGFGKTQLKQPTVTRSGESCKCAKFVSESARYAGISTSVIPNASAASPFNGSNQFGFIGSDGNVRYGCQAFTYQDFKNGTYTPQKGDIIFYGYMKSNKGGTSGMTVHQVAADGSYWHTHVGIVRNNESTKSKIYTIEGNTSGTDINGVKRSSGYTFNKTRTISNTSTGYMWSQGKNNSTKIYIMEFIRPAFQQTTSIAFSFNANGGNGSMSTTSENYGSEYSFPANGFTYDGHIFEGWNLYCPANGTWYVDGYGWMNESAISAAGTVKRLFAPGATVTLNDTLINPTGSTSFTLFAVWRQNGSGGVSGNISWSYNPSSYTLTITGSGQMPDYKRGNDPRPWKDYAAVVRSIQIGNGITNISEDAFQDFTALTSVSLPTTLKSIGRSAFQGTTSLTSIVFPAGLESIQWWAFWRSGLTSVHLPASVIDLEIITVRESTEGDISGESMGSPFWRCPIASITVEDGNPSYCAENNALLTKDRTHLILGSRVSGAYTVPDGVEVIEGYAFEDCEEMTSVSLPSSLRRIEQYAFSGCYALTSVRTSGGSTGFPDNVEKIGYHAFDVCLELQGIHFDGSKSKLREIASYAFDECCKVNAIHIPARVERIGSLAFGNVGDYVKSGDFAVIYFYGDPPQISSDSFSGVSREDGSAYTVYYPTNRPRWTSDKLQNYGGNLSWSKNRDTNVYDVFYDANGGANPPDNNTATWLLSSFWLVIPNEVPDRTGYEFLGWSLDPNAT